MQLFSDLTTRKTKTKFIIGQLAFVWKCKKYQNPLTQEIPQQNLKNLRKDFCKKKFHKCTWVSYWPNKMANRIFVRMFWHFCILKCSTVNKLKWFVNCQCDKSIRAFLETWRIFRPEVLTNVKTMMWLQLIELYFYQFIAEHLNAISLQQIKRSQQINEIFFVPRRTILLLS